MHSSQNSSRQTSPHSNLWKKCISILLLFTLLYNYPLSLFAGKVDDTVNGIVGIWQNDYGNKVNSQDKLDTIAIYKRAFTLVQSGVQDRLNRLSASDASSTSNTSSTSNPSIAVTDSYGNSTCWTQSVLGSGPLYEIVKKANDLVYSGSTTNNTPFMYCVVYSGSTQTQPHMYSTLTKRTCGFSSSQDTAIRNAENETCWKADRTAASVGGTSGVENSSTINGNGVNTLDLYISNYEYVPIVGGVKFATTSETSIVATTFNTYSGGFHALYNPRNVGNGNMTLQNGNLSWVNSYGASPSSIMKLPPKVRFFIPPGVISGSSGTIISAGVQSSIVSAVDPNIGYRVVMKLWSPPQSTKDQFINTINNTGDVRINILKDLFASGQEIMTYTAPNTGGIRLLSKSLDNDFFSSKKGGWLYVNILEMPGDFIIRFNMLLTTDKTCYDKWFNDPKTKWDADGNPAEGYNHTCDANNGTVIESVVQSSNVVAHDPAYPSLTQSIITPATSYKEILETMVNPQYTKDRFGAHYFGCRSMLNGDTSSHVNIYQEARDKCGNVNDGISIQDTMINISSSMSSEISPGNKTKGRIWVPAGASIDIGAHSFYDPKHMIAFRWGSPPEYTQEALNELYSIEKITGEANIDGRRDTSYPSLNLFFKKRGYVDGINQYRGTGFGGLLSLDTTLKTRSSSIYEDTDFVSGKTTRLGMGMCFDQGSCGGNVLNGNKSFLREFKIEKSGWLYFDSLNIKDRTDKLIPERRNESALTFDIIFPDSNSIKKVLSETEWDANGEPK